MCLHTGHVSCAISLSLSLSRPLLLLLPDVLCAALSRRMRGLLWGGPTPAAALTLPVEVEGEGVEEAEAAEV